MKNFLGHKQCPSLSKAMQNSVLIRKHQNYSHSQQSPSFYSNSQNLEIKFENIERNLFKQIELNLTKHYKHIKSELNKVRNQIDATDLFLDRIENVIDSVSNYLIENDNICYSQISDQKEELSDNAQPRKMKWRKQSDSQKKIKSSSKIIKQTDNSNSKPLIKSSFIIFE